MPTFEVEATDLVKIRRIYHVEAANADDARRKAAAGKDIVFVDEKSGEKLERRDVDKVVEIDADGRRIRRGRIAA